MSWFTVLLIIQMSYGLIYFADASLVRDIAEWNLYKRAHSKHYANLKDDLYHMKTFLKHKLYIEEHNQQYEDGLVSFQMGYSKYTDVHNDYMKSAMNGYKGHHNHHHHNHHSHHSNHSVDNLYFMGVPHPHLIPESMDWRQHGAVTGVKDQSFCGSCWAFSTTGALEGQYFRKSGVLVSLSEQELVDCTIQYANHGCNGGLPNRAYLYAMQTGVDSEASYPYSGESGICRNNLQPVFHAQNQKIKATGLVQIPSGNEQKLKEAIATIGPISVNIDASHPSFQLYSRGIYSEPSCSSEHLDHSVLIVGYGTDEFKQDYYIVKNSWGSSWGENGYFKLSRNHNNHCGIATSATYPLV